MIFYQKFECFVRFVLQFMVVLLRNFAKIRAFYGITVYVNICKFFFKINLTSEKKTSILCEL